MSTEYYHIIGEAFKITNKSLFSWFLPLKLITLQIFIDFVNIDLTIQKFFSSCSSEIFKQLLSFCQLTLICIKWVPEEPSTTFLVTSSTQKIPRMLRFHEFLHFHVRKHMISSFYLKWTEFTRTFELCSNLVWTPEDQQLGQNSQFLGNSVQIR